MLPGPELQLLVSGFAMAAIGAALILSTMFDHNRLTRIGNIAAGIGAFVTALGIAAVLNPVQGITAKEVLAIWIASLGLLIVATAMPSQSPSRTRRVFVACRVVCLLLNVWAIVLLLWIATVSPGGV